MRTLTFLLLCAVSSLTAQPIKVMTYNIRLDTQVDGVNQWDKRKHKVFAVLQKYQPDIFGVQEAKHNQMQDIAGSMTDFIYFGVGRDDGQEKGEHSAVFVRRDRFTVLDQGTFWLSKTPEVPGSKDWDAAITRIATWGRLEDKRSGDRFLVVNTHFDHVGKESRSHSAALIKERALALSQNLPIIMTGDFNFTREAPPYQVMMDPAGLQLLDSNPNTPGTSCGFAVGARSCSAIDYIFHTRDWESRDYQVIQDNDGTYYPSDHLPVMVTLTRKK